jgi:hypothetical protein
MPSRFLFLVALALFASSSAACLCQFSGTNSVPIGLYPFSTIFLTYLDARRGISFPSLLRKSTVDALVSRERHYGVSISNEPSGLAITLSGDEAKDEIIIAWRRNRESKIQWRECERKPTKRKKDCVAKGQNMKTEPSGSAAAPRVPILLPMTMPMSSRLLSLSLLPCVYPLL